jgi:SAM-dependent methyltransferase
MREENINRLSSYEISINHPQYLGYKFYHNDLFECIKKFANGKLLDIGCGNKPYAKLINDLVEEYIGCDVVQSSEKTVDIICEATDIQLQSESFNTIISTQTIEHVAEHQQLVNEAYRLLKYDGFFIVSGPMYWPLHEEPYDFFRFTKHGFKYILNKAGFTIYEERSNGGKWALCGQSLIHALYPDLNTQSSLNWKVLRHALNILGGIKFINRFFSKMDEKYLDTSSTMNYVIVARKERN